MASRMRSSPELEFVRVVVAVFGELLGDFDEVRVAVQRGGVMLGHDFAAPFQFPRGA
jgi:hypothetical protein